jgi:Transposase DDE domain
MITAAMAMYHQQVRTFFTQTADAIAHQTGFVRRTRLITGSLFLQALVWTVYKYGQITMPALAATAEELEPQCHASEQAFQARFQTQAVACLQAMVAKALHYALLPSAAAVPLLSTFSAVSLLDSTVVALPAALTAYFAGCGGDASAAAAKVFLLLNWLTGSYEALELRDGRKADQNMGTPFLAGRPPGALWLFDRGFWSLEFFGAIAREGSYFVSRLQSQVTLSVHDRLGQVVTLELEPFLKRAPRQGSFEMPVLIGPKQQLACRLLCSPVPPAVANARRRRAKKNAQKTGRTPSKRMLARLSWSLYITNAAPEALPTSMLESVYRVRWQVELAFKLAKSQAGLARSTSEKPERVLCELYAKLLAWWFFARLHQLIPGAAQISWPKGWRRLTERLRDWGRELRQTQSTTVFADLVAYLGRRARATKKRKHPSTLRRLEQATSTAEMRQMPNVWQYMPAGGNGRGKSLSAVVVQPSLGGSQSIPSKEAA